MLEWAGISFGEEFTYKLGKSIKVTNLQQFHHGLETCYHEWSYKFEILRKDLRISQRLFDRGWYIATCRRKKLRQNG